MTNHSDGNSPTLRPQLGYGWNRALPAPFGFDNGLKPDGVNDYMRVPNSRLTGFDMPSTGYIVFWTKMVTPTVLGFPFEIITGAGSFYMIVSSTGQIGNYLVYGIGSSTTVYTPAAGDKVMVIVEWTATQSKRSIYHPLGVAAGAVVPYTISGSQSVSSLNIAAVNASGGNYQHWLDCFQIYKGAFSSYIGQLLYNSGVGENPWCTEDLLAWYTFQEFENLDMSALQDGSDIQLGIRDHSGNARHLKPFNMDTNPASGSYVLQPF